jgi:predicted DNA-binding transcriptional regulator YafY
VIARLGPALSWLEETPAPTAPALPFIALQSRGAIEAPHGIRYWGKGIPLEAVRFAGTNRLLISFTYDRKPRLVEPYSLRRPATGNLLLFGWEVSAGQIKAFNVDEMVGLQATSTPFVPRFRVELAALG